MSLDLSMHMLCPAPSDLTVSDPDLYIPAVPGPVGPDAPGPDGPDVPTVLSVYPDTAPSVLPQTSVILLESELTVWTALGVVPEWTRLTEKTE